MTSAIERGAPLPLYFQLKQALLDSIESRGLRPGDRFPSEAEIERTYDVSRATIRQALMQLVNEGHIERIQGKGTFVAVPRLTQTPRLTSFTENMRDQGHEPARRILAVEAQPVPPDVASELGLDDSASCLHLRRLLLADQKPVGLAETWLPLDTLGERAELLTPASLADSSLYDLLQREVGLVIHRGVETVYPRLADAELSATIGCRKGSPMLVVERDTFGPAGEPIEFSRLVFDGSRYRYRAELYDHGGR